MSHSVFKFRQGLQRTMPAGLMLLFLRMIWVFGLFSLLGLYSPLLAADFSDRQKMDQKKFSDLMRWNWEREKPEPKAFPVVPVNVGKLSNWNSNPEAFSVTWIGHSTFLIQIGGLNILTDPHFSDRASPLHWAGPMRMTPVPMDTADLPKIDLVLISHDHYDHLDKNSVTWLYARQKEAPPLFLAGLETQKWFESVGISSSKDMEWWTTTALGEHKITFLPAQHWSKRSMFSQNTRLWGSFMLEYGDKKVYFGGDTGMDSTLFQKIHEQFGPIDLAFLPIGAYEPRWFMKDQHINPAEAVAIHHILQSRWSVGMHWGTFQLTDEEPDAPPAELALAMEALHQSLSVSANSETDTTQLNDRIPGVFQVMTHGESIFAWKNAPAPAASSPAEPEDKTLLAEKEGDLSSP